MIWVASFRCSGADPGMTDRSSHQKSGFLEQPGVGRVEACWWGTFGAMETPGTWLVVMVAAVV